MPLYAQADGGLKFLGMTLGSPYAWFNIQYGQNVDASLALANRPYGLLGPNSIQIGSIYYPPPGDSFLFGWWGNPSNLESDPGPGDCFGWVRLVIENGNVVILDDAVETTGVGIIAGTLRAVPEPSSMFILMIGGGALLQIRRTTASETRRSL